MKSKKLPHFKSDEEFAKFVETHDMAPYLDSMKPVVITKFEMAYPDWKSRLTRATKESGKGIPLKTYLKRRKKNK